MSFVGDMKGRAGEVTDRLLTATGFGHSEARLAADATAYWTQADDDTWLNNTHIHTGSAMTENDTWERVGREHLALFEQMTGNTPELSWQTGRAVEWGVGGGSNAVAFAPHVKEFFGVDLSQRIVDEAAHQVGQRTETPFTPVVLELPYLGAAWQQIGKVDLFLCLYVLELVPSPQHGLDIMTMAHEMLNPGGLAFVQIKYDTGRWNTRSRGRNYKGWRAASQTAYRIDEFWGLMTDIGFEIPTGVVLVPRNELDERYAYFLLRKPSPVM